MEVGRWMSIGGGECTTYGLKWRDFGIGLCWGFGLGGLHGGEQAVECWKALIGGESRLMYSVSEIMTWSLRVHRIVGRVGRAIN